MFELIQNPSVLKCVSTSFSFWHPAPLYMDQLRPGVLSYWQLNLENCVQRATADRLWDWLQTAACLVRQCIPMDIRNTVQKSDISAEILALTG